MLSQLQTDIDAPKIETLEEHYIICGVGRTGAYIAEDFFRRKVPFVVIEQNPKELHRLQERFRDLGGRLLSITGDATEDETLEAVGIQRAKGLLTAMGDDKLNLFVVLTARSMNENIKIVTRVNEERFNRSKLERAGADKIVSNQYCRGPAYGVGDDSAQRRRFFGSNGSSDGKKKRRYGLLSCPYRV